MPCAAVVCQFSFPYQLHLKCSCDAKGTTEQILKPFVVTPCLKSGERYCCTVLHSFVATLWLKQSLSLKNKCIHWLILKLFIMNASVGVAICVHLAVGIAVQVAVGLVKRSGHKDPMAYTCDVSCVTGSSSWYRKMNPQTMASHGSWILSNWHIVCADHKLCRVYANVRMLGMVNCEIDIRRVFSLKLGTPFNVLLCFHYVRMYKCYWIQTSFCTCVSSLLSCVTIQGEHFFVVKAYDKKCFKLKEAHNLWFE